MQRFIKMLGAALIATLGALLLLLTSLLLYFSLIRVADINNQARHVAALRDLYDEGYRALDEQQFANFNLKESDLKLNEIQLLATHNSYKKLGSPVAKLFIGLGESFAEANALKYENNSLTDQLNHGVRSFELDLRCRKGDFEVIHVPLVDNSSTVPKLNLAMEEVLLWSEHNPGHVPIMILLELKDDWMILDPALSDFTGADLAQLDHLVGETFGERLFSPGDMIGPGESLNLSVREKGWPFLRDLLGKVIFILHPGKYTDMYVPLDPDFGSLAMFPAAWSADTGETHASFIVHNEPAVDALNGLVSDNYIVRTRLDSDLEVSESRFKDGLASGAQILTTDYGPNHNFKETDYVAYPADGYTIIANIYLQGGSEER